MLPDIFIHLHMKLLLQIRNRWCTSTNAVDTAQTLLVDRHATLSCSTLEELETVHAYITFVDMQCLPLC